MTINLTTSTRQGRVRQRRRPRNGSTRAWRRVRAAVLCRDRFVCAYCGAMATHVDHVVPRAAGGSDSPVNLVAACARCNLTKGANVVVRRDLTSGENVIAKRDLVRGGGGSRFERPLRTLRVQTPPPGDGPSEISVRSQEW